MTTHPKDLLENAFLVLTILYYLGHLRVEMLHAWHRACARLRKGTINRRSIRAIAMIIVMIAPGGCMQSGPALLYLMHLAGKVTGEQVQA